MRPIATDGVPWSVCVSVGHICEPCKTAQPIDMPFGRLTRVGPWNHILDVVEFSSQEGTIMGVVRLTKKH